MGEMISSLGALRLATPLRQAVQGSKPSYSTTNHRHISATYTNLKRSQPCLGQLTICI